MPKIRCRLLRALQPRPAGPRPDATPMPAPQVAHDSHADTADHRLLQACVEVLSASQGLVVVHDLERAVRQRLPKLDRLLAAQTSRDQRSFRGFLNQHRDLFELDDRYVGAVTVRQRASLTRAPRAQRATRLESTQDPGSEQEGGRSSMSLMAGRARLPASTSGGPLARWLLASTLAATVLAFAVAPAHAARRPPGEDPLGLDAAFERLHLGASVSASVGLGVCVPNGDSECGDMGPGFDFSVGGEFRFLPFLAAALELDFGLLHPDTSDLDPGISTRTWHLHLMPKIVGILRLDDALEIQARAGLGLAVFGVDVWNSDASANIHISGLGLTVGLGAGYWLMSNLQALLRFDLFYHASVGEACLTTDSPSESKRRCETLESDNDIAAIFTARVGVRFAF